MLTNRNKKSKIMEVKITITIKTQNEDFDKDELIRDIKWQFADITGYDIETIEVEEQDE